jgi:hypothetical protein
MGTDAAPLGTELFQLTLGQATTEAIPDGPRFDGGW